MKDSNETKKKVKINKKDIKKVREIASELFSLIGVEVELDTVFDKKNEAILINVKAERESGLLIGARGETLISLQTVISMIFQQQSENWIRILLNIADWREKEEERLQRMAEQIADRARSTKELQTLYNLTANQRRIIHMALADEKDLVTESQGEGKNRYLTIRIK
jgi:spoIIIJ-associated protein